MAGQGISVPISLLISNLLNIVTMLLSKLSNLKVGTSGFKALLNIIATILKDIDKLTILTDKPFVSANLFTSADRAVNKLEEDLDKVQIAVSRIKFSDLELDPSLTAELKSFETLIESIKNSLKTVKETAKLAFLDSDVGKGWAHDHAEATTLTLSQLTTAISKEVDKLQRELDAAQEAVANYQRTLSVSKNINKFMSKSSGHQLSEATMGKELFQLIFKTNTEGEVTRFLNGGKPLLQQWLQEQFDLDSATILSLTTGAGDAIVKAFSEIGGKVEAALKALLLKMRNAATELKTATDKGTTLDAAVNEKAAKLQLAQATQAQLVASNTSVSTSEALLRAELEQTKQLLAEYKERLAEAVRTNPDWTNSNKLASAALELLKSTLSLTNAQFLQQQRVMQSFNSMKMAVVNFMGFNLVLNITRNAVREAINHIKELDTVMNGIAIVTDMSTGDLWTLIDQYSKMAQAYGVSITGAYEVSQIYYQQGLETADVMTLTNETLKLAKISGLDYATTTDYMTTAIRGFKMEMSEASTVVDVYSNLAAHTAVSQEELAVAMSKTASSMEGVGATFEEASAMIGTMVAVTRESATNIGSAMKSIASRYGELTKDPTKLVDEEGEAMAFNKVDAALQSVGISMKTVDGQFREFTDVIVELGEKWDQLDSTQQRYIATLFAGNRQQSRFLALVSNVDLLKSNLDVAMNSEDTGTLQALKALDSIESKIELVKVAYQLFYTTIGAESVWKGFLDGTKNIINTLNGLPKLFGKIPIGAIAAISSIISLIKNLGMDLLSTFAQTFGLSLLLGALLAQGQALEGAQSLIGIVLNTIKSKKEEFTAAGKEDAEAYTQGILLSNTPITSNKLTGQDKITYDNNQNIIDTFKTKTALFSVTGDDNLNSAYAILANQMQGLPVDILEKINTDESLAKLLLDDYIASLEKANLKLLETGNTAEQSGGKLKKFIANHKNLGLGLQSFGSALNMVAMTINTTAEGGKTWSGVLLGMASAATLAGVAVKVLDSGLKSMPWMALASGVLMAVNAISTLIVTPEERLEELENKAEELDNKAKEAKADYRTLDNSIKKLDELRETRYESAEAAEEYLNAVDELTKKFPALIGGFDEAGNIILNVTNAENVLAEARKKSQLATYDAAKAELEASKHRLNESRGKVKDIFDKMGSGAGKVFSGATEASLKTIDAFANFADEHYYGFNKEDIDPQMIDSLIEYMIKDIAKGSLDLTLWEKYLSTVKNENGLYDFSLSSYGNFLSLQEELSPLATDILNLINTLYGSELLTSNIAEIDAAINKFNASTGTDEIIENYNNLMELLNLLFSTEEGKLSGSLYLPIYDLLQDLSKEIDNTVTENTLYTSFKKQVISAWQLSIHANVSAWEYLKLSSNAAGMVTDFINKTIENDYDGDYEKAKEAEEVNWRKYLSTMSTFLSSLSDERLTLFNSMTDDTANYSAEDIIKEFNIKDISDSLDDLYDIIINYYQSGIDSIRERLTKNLASASGKNLQYNKDTLDITGDLLTGFYEHYQKLILLSSTKVLEEYLNNILKNYSSMAESGYTQSAYEYGTAALNAFDIIRLIGGSLEKNIWSIINEKGINTINSINEIIDAINNNQEIKDEDKTNLISYFTTMSSKLISNINLEIQAATSDLLENWENTSKELNSALSSGVSLKEADALINKAKNLGLDFSLQDFLLVGDKLVLIGESWDNYYNKLTESITSSTAIWQARIDLANKAFSTISNYGLSTIPTNILQDYKAALEAIGFTDWNNREYVTLWGTLTKEGKLHIQDLIDNTTDELTEYSRATTIATRLILTAHETSLGIYKLIINEVETNLSEDLEKLKIIAKGGTLGGNALDERAIKDNINNVYNTFISDVLSKGFENIRIEDYEGLVNAKDIQLKDISYEQFVKDYIDYTGASIDEANNLLALAMQKDTERISSEVLSNLQFINKNQFVASLSDLTELANRFDIGLGDLTTHWNQALGAYIVDITQIDAFKNFTGVENYQAIINDSINEFFSNLVNLIKSALSGSLSNTDRGKLDLWVANYNELFGTNLKLDFIKTADGLLLATNSAKELYTVMNLLDSILGSVIFETLKDNLIETDERFKSAASNAAYIREIESRGLTSDQLGILLNLKGNVDLFNRPVLQNADGSITTIFASTEDSRNYKSKIPWVMNITPVTPAGKELSDTELLSYIQKLVEESSGNMDKMIKLDKGQLGLIIEGENTEIEHQEEILKAYDERAEKLHDISNAIEENKQKSAEELALAQKIAEARGLSEDDSFKFMELAIPDAQNNPLNYWENWGKAYKAMNEASKTGKMDYSTFYNLATEMGNLAQMTGKAIPLGKETVSNAETAAALIEKAAGALQIQADGSVKIDLSRIGVDFVSGADKMNANIEDGIHLVALSQIEMLDSIIGLLETIVTMEDAFKEFNVDSDMDMKLDLDEIFDIEYNEDKSIEKINGFAKNWENALNYLRDRLDPTKLDTYSEDLARGADSIKFAINGFEISLADLIKTDFNDLSNYGFTPENLNIYQNIMQGVYDAILSGDFTEKNVKELIMLKLQNNLGDGGEIVFDMGNYTFIGSGGMLFSIDWDDNNTKAALNQLEGTVEQKLNLLIEANKARGKNKATPFLYLTTLIAEGAVKVEDGKGKVNIEGKEYSYDAAHPEKWTGLLGAAELDKLGAKGIEWENDTPVAATGTLKMGKREVKVEASDKGKIHYVADDGTPYDSPRDLVDAEVDKQWKADMEKEGVSDELSDEAQILKKKAKYQVEMEYGISSFALNSLSYQELNEQILKDLEKALKSGNLAKIDAVIDANVELAELKGLSSSEIEEKLGIKKVNVKFEGDTEAATTALTGLKNTVEELTKEPIKLKAESDPSISKAATTLQTLKNKLDAIDDTNPNISISTDETVGATQTALESISSELSKIAAMKTLTINITKSITTSETTTTKTTAPSADIDAITGATGTIGLAKAQGTLMGELGPELIVSNGRYFVAGLNGPEFVDLASDAIVFNHLLTEQLLKHGMSSTRGQAVTNERNAVAFASGNINGGPALASAKAVLGQLKQLRSMWQSLLGSSVKDLAGKGGSGGGGGGGGKDAAKDPAFVKDLEKWYNWLQRIAVLEEKINYEEAKRNKIASDMIAHGQDYAKSLLESFNYLKEQTAVHQSLADSQLIYFNLRREQMNSASNPFSALYTFDEYGQLKYKNGALAQLSEIISRDLLTGKGTYTASEQYAILKNNGFERYMQYDSSGNEIDRSQEGWETNAILAFWDKIDADKEEMQSLHDSIEEHKKAVLEDQEKANEILKEIEDNLISVEDKVLKAIEDTRQREIDELLKQRDAIEESANNLINGLSELLNREKDMYSQLTSLDELTRLLRQLSILLNSGGSASQIANLLKEIGLKQLDAYFEAQLRQIDTLLLASLNELERLDRLIDLMTESLEYEKENGLLWGAVYEVMAGTPEQITSFITEHDSQYWGVSPTLLTLDTRDILFEAQLFVTYRLEMKDGITGMIDAFNSYKVETEKQLEDTRKLAMDASGANSGSAKKETGGGSGGSPGGASKPAGGKKVASTSYIDAGNSGHKIHVVYNDGTSSDKLEAHNWDKKIITGGTKTCYCSKCNHYMGIVYPGDAHFSQGGMIDYTGPAMVHGSKSRPESVLNAELTKILRDNILSNKPNSLINLLQTYNNGYDANALIPTTKEGVIIEQATVEMHVAQIANDYDASRAGEQALEKIMAIARKSLGSTRIGR